MTGLRWQFGFAAGGSVPSRLKFETETLQSDKDLRLWLACRGLAKPLVNMASAPGRQKGTAALELIHLLTAGKAQDSLMAQEFLASGAAEMLQRQMMLCTERKGFKTWAAALLAATVANLCHTHNKENQDKLAHAGRKRCFVGCLSQAGTSVENHHGRLPLTNTGVLVPLCEFLSLGEEVRQQAVEVFLSLTI